MPAQCEAASYAQGHARKSVPPAVSAERLCQVCDSVRALMACSRAPNSASCCSRCCRCAARFASLAAFIAATLCRFTASFAAFAASRVAFSCAHRFLRSCSVCWKVALSAASFRCDSAHCCRSSSDKGRGAEAANARGRDQHRRAHVLQAHKATGCQRMSEAEKGGGDTFAFCSMISCLLSVKRRVTPPRPAETTVPRADDSLQFRS